METTHRHESSNMPPPPIISPSCEQFVVSTFRRNTFRDFAEAVLQHDMQKYGQLKILLIPSPIGFRPSTRSVEDAREFLQWVNRLRDVSPISFPTFRKVMRQMTAKKTKKKKRRKKMPKLSKIKSNFKIATLNLSGISKVSLFSKKSNEKYDIDDLLQINKTSSIPALRCPYSKETTLHYAIRSHAPYEVIRAIVDNHPENLCLKDINGSYPVHLVRDPHVRRVVQISFNVTRMISEQYLCNTYPNTGSNSDLRVCIQAHT